MAITSSWMMQPHLCLLKGGSSVELMATAKRPRAIVVGALLNDEGRTHTYAS